MVVVGGQQGKEQSPIRRAPKVDAAVATHLRSQRLLPSCNVKLTVDMHELGATNQSEPPLHASPLCCLSVPAPELNLLVMQRSRQQQPKTPMAQLKGL